MTAQSIDTGAILMRERAESGEGTGRAAATDRTGNAAGLRVEVVDLSGLRQNRDAWKALSGRSLEPNIFYDPDFALPAIEALGYSEKIRAALVWSDAGTPNEPRQLLTGFFPYVEQRRWGVPVKVGEAFIHPYAMSSAPLVDAEKAEETVEAFFDWLEHDAASPTVWLSRFLPADGDLAAAILSEGRNAGATLRGFGSYERAVLDSKGLVADTFFKEALGAKRQREYRRQRRKIVGHGKVTVTRAETGDDVHAAMEEFLALESSGWKGRRGTAAGLSPETRRMFEQIAGGLGSHHEMRIDALRVDGRAVAMAVSCGHDRIWWLWKVAYDEEFAAYSPGVLLLLEITERAISEGKGEHYDSCALPGIALVERVWRQRRPYRDLLIAPARLGRYGRTTALGLEASRRLAEATAKKALTLLGRR